MVGESPKRRATATHTPPRMRPRAGRTSALEAMAGTLPGRREGHGRRAVAQPVEAIELVLRAPGEPRELRGVEPGVARRDLLERTPQAELAGDAGDEPLDLDHAAERRVAADLPVRLQAPGLLGAPRERGLDGRRLDVAAGHDPLERLAVLVDLAGEPRQRAAELGPLVGLRGALGQLEAAGR